MISRQAQSSAFTNSVTSPLTQAISRDTAWAALAVTKLISFVHVQVCVKTGGRRACWISSHVPNAQKKKGPRCVYVLCTLLFLLMVRATLQPAPPAGASFV